MNKYIEDLNEETYSQLVDVPALDRYRKKLTSYTFLLLMIYAQFTQKESLTALAEDVGDSDDLKSFLGLGSIHKSTLSRHLREYSPKVFDDILQHLMLEIQRQEPSPWHSPGIKNLNVVDSSVISMCFSENPWATYRKTKAGVKIHLKVRVHKEMPVPDKLLLSPAVHADRTKMEPLVNVDPDAIYLFDRAYNDYNLYDDYCEKGISFITRLKENAVYDILSTQRVANDEVTKRDAEVKLGGNYNQMKYSLRLIETTDSTGERVLILTNCFHKSALEIGDLYRQRWKIETFFKWMKQHLKLKTLFGKSENAVYNQILTAFITYCLLVLLKIKTGFKGKLLRLKRCLLHNCFSSFTDFKLKLFRRASRASRGRQSYDFEWEFEQIQHQYQRGEVELFNHLRYDPLFL
ncbi:IS4 family transposase [Bacillus marinisedimentorum]|uniref:IS4 family transposase n=1 Tax=Bacillus marinisedimentorum TaxID=1821260 RepID=UPI000872A5ED|nr:IS4 family transposase [Bacillus marinisedimentorum]